MEVIWTEGAIEQYRTAYTYLLENAGNIAADKIADKIEDAAANLVNHPKMGGIEKLLEHKVEGYRSFVAHKNYKIVYYIEDDKIYITSLFDCRQNPIKIQKK